MPYPGVPAELNSKMGTCVKKLTKDGKTEEYATSLCKTSIMSQVVPEEKEKPMKVVADKDTHHLYFSSSEFAKEDKVNASKEGRLLKNIEIFRAGTYKGVEFKSSALDKMVANFHYLKAFNKFPNVPVRADHPAIFGVGGVINRVGGYIADLKKVGTKLVADFRITNDEMWERIIEGTYISRSAEIGTYDDNDGTIYSPILFGVAWVDIPAVEGLSPKFSLSKDKNVKLLNLNLNESMNKEKSALSKETEAVEVESEKEETPITPVKEEESKKTKEVKVEIPLKKESAKTEIEKNDKVETESLSFAKQFPKEAGELEKYRIEVLENFFDKLVTGGKLLPVSKEKCLVFAKDLSAEKLESFKILLSSFPKSIKLDKEVEGEEGEVEKEDEKDDGKDSDKKADAFIKETN